MPGKATFPFFPFGACHHADFLKQSPPHDPAQYKAFMRDELQAMKDLGLNSYNMNFAWFDLEIRRDVFEWRRVDAVYELCDRIGLPVFAWIFAELTPRWLVRDHPETAAVAATGYSGPSHSYGSALVRDRMRRYIGAVVERFDRDGRILAYNVGVESGLFWNEEQDSSEPAARLWDYNPEVVGGFRAWLREKYGTIDELNRVYRDHYLDFAEVEAPNSRFIQEQFMLINQVNWIDWRLYMCDLVTDYIHFKAACVRELRPDAVVAEQSYVIKPAVNGQDLWRTNAKMDAVGTSCFVSNVEGEHSLGSYWHDVFRSAAKGKPYWLWELRCGQNAWGLTSWGLPISANDVGRYTWHAVAHEVKNIQYWNWRPHIGGIEVGGHGLTHRDGSLTDRAERVGRIARAINADAAFYAGLKLAPAGIAILEPKLPRIVAAGEGDDQLVLDAQVGLYTTLRNQGYRIDFLHEDEVAAGGLAAYRLLLVPFGYAMHSETARRIESWVAEGGFLFAGLWCGAKDEHGFGEPHVPGHGLHTVFGAEEHVLTPVRGEGDQQITNMSMQFGERITGRPTFTVTAPLREGGLAKAGATLQGYRYFATLTPAKGARVIAVDAKGAPVVTDHRYVEGRALLFGSFPIRPSSFAADALDDLLGDFAAEAGITAPAVVLERGGREVETEVLFAQDGRALLVVLTPGSDPCHVIVRVEGRFSAARDAETGAAVPVTPEGSATRMSIDLDPGDGRAIQLDP